MFPSSWWTTGAVIALPDGTLSIGYGYHKWKSFHELDRKLPVFYSPDFFLKSPKPWCQFEHNTIISLKELADTIDTEYTTRISWEMLDVAPFHKAFADIKSQIKAGILQKAVPYTFLHSAESITKLKLQSLLHNALAFMKKNGGWLYGFWTASQGILGVTPEVLFHSTGAQLTTMALAGTKSRQQGSRALLSDPKERHEHQLVIDGISKSLQPFGKINVGSTEVIKLPTFFHLKTSIEVILNSKIEFGSIVKALHPTPALGAFPYAAGSLWLKKYQKVVPRGRYGAPFGFVHGDLSYCLVAIRNMQWDNDGLRLGAGCGVVKDSHIDKEWNEVQMKLGSIKKIMGMT